jgi:two-component system, NtrC family, nitrogen regulation sensor histidine kinase NtrY
MTFRRKLLAVFALTVFFSVAAVAFLVSAVTRRAFTRGEDERTAALETQFRREFNRRGEEVARRIEAIAVSDPVNRMALALNRAPADPGPYFELAKNTAENDRLDFLEFVNNDGAIISSAQWPAKFGYRENAAVEFATEAKQGFFLKQEELPEGAALGLFAVRATTAGEHPVYVIGGRLLDKTFLSELDLPAGMRVMLYENRGNRFDEQFLVDPSVGGTDHHDGRSLGELQPLVDASLQSRKEMSGLVHWSPNSEEDEIFHAIPLFGAGGEETRTPLAILLIGNSRRMYVDLTRRIRSAAFMVGGCGIVVAILLSSWVAARVTRPVEQLAQAAREVAAGKWDTRVDVLSADELGQLADSFNRMTTELLGQKERLMQAERVAAWRELARRLAHDLKNPLFPLQLTVENLVRARQQDPDQFEQLFRESSRTLLAEISNLKGIIGRFNEFSKIPQPQLAPVKVNDVIRDVVQLFSAQWERAGSSPAQSKITCDLQLDPWLQPIPADSDLLHRAISNLVLNATEAMPCGGTLTLRTRGDDGKVKIEVADTGSGLTAEECERIFAPYYTSKSHGTGLGLAIVQSVISDHGGTIRVQSEKGQGTTFMIELPRNAGPRNFAATNSPPDRPNS